MRAWALLTSSILQVSLLCPAGPRWRHTLAWGHYAQVEIAVRSPTVHQYYWLFRLPIIKFSVATTTVENEDRRFYTNRFQPCRCLPASDPLSSELDGVSDWPEIPGLPSPPTFCLELSDSQSLTFASHLGVWRPNKYSAFSMVSTPLDASEIKNA